MTMPDLDGLPAADRIARGLADLQRGRRSLEALWMAAAAGRLRSLGLPVPPPAGMPADPELALYEVLRGVTDDPYYRYNALRAELDSFIAALEARVERSS